MDRRDLVQRSRLRVGMAALGIGIASLALTCAQAQETKTYSYDALGRLVATNTNGGPNNGVVVGTCFDAAGNRTQFLVGGTAAACTPSHNQTQANAAPVKTQATSQSASASSAR